MYKLSPLIFLYLFTITTVSSSLPGHNSTTRPTTASESTTTTVAPENDNNYHDDNHDHYRLVVSRPVEQATAESAVAPEQLVGAIVRSSVDQVKPILASHNNEGNNDSGVDTPIDGEDYDSTNDPDGGEGDYGPEDPVAKSIPKSEVTANETIDIIRLWTKLTGNTVATVLKEFTPLGVQLSYDLKVSTECASSFLKVFSGIQKQELWAFRMADAYGRITPGVLDGTVSDFGEYDQCLSVNFPREDMSQPEVVGKYCMMLLNMPLPPRKGHVRVNVPVLDFRGTDLEGTMVHELAARWNQMYTLKGFRFGICIPSTCTAEEIGEVVNKVVVPLLRTNVTVGPDWTCDTRLDTYAFTRTQLVAIAILMLSVTLVTVGTVYDWGIRMFYHDDDQLQNSKVGQSILAFSIVRNTERLFHFREDRENTLSAVHGMRVLSMFWIIIGHTYCFGGFYKIIYTFKRLAIDSLTNPSRWEYQALINAFLLVETFFFLGGVVLIYVALPMLEKHRGRFNYLVYVVHRWSRLTPTLLGVICFIMLMPVMGTGPIWKREMSWQSEGCQKNWWMNLLFINNWVDPVDEMCGGQTWFIAADFQIYLFAPIIFLAYYRSAIFGIVVNVTLMVAGMASSGISSYINEAWPTYGVEHIVDLENLHRYSKIGYFPTYHHIAPYCFGTLVGYFILKYREHKPQISPRVQVLAWITSISASLFILFCTQGWNDASTLTEPARAVSVTFSIFQRMMWSCGVAWITFACATGYGGIVNKILSHAFWVPLSRLSYSIYMVHLIPIFLRTNSLRYTRAWDDFMFMSWAVMNIFLGVFGAYILHLFFEAPMQSLERIVLRRSGADEGSPKIRKDMNNNDNRSTEIGAGDLNGSYRKRDSESESDRSDSGHDDTSGDVKVDVDSSSDSGRSSRKSHSHVDCSKA